MNQKLLKNNYIIIPNFINSNRAKKLGKDFKNYSESNNKEGDPQAPNSRTDYNYISFLELLCEKTKKISSLVQETVLPTYTYSRVYYKGSVLERHTDRDACEISLTLHLDGDKSWPIHIQTPRGEEKSIILRSGDAMLYLGKIAEHWRNVYDGEYYTQVFLHYVRSRGDCAYAYFDKIQNNIELEKNTNSTQLIMPNPKNTLDQYIHVFEDIVSEQICDEILSEYENSNDWSDTMVGDMNVDKNIRNCDQILISSPETIAKNNEKRTKIDNMLISCVRSAVDRYSRIHKEFLIDIDTGYQLLRYKEGNFYIQHTDSFKKEQRSVSCSIQLNDDYEGGEFAFFDRQTKIKAKKGSVIMFPSNFMFPHEIMPVTKGIRYSIITWLV